MSLKDKSIALIKRYGTPAKFAAKLVLGAVLPGSPAVVELVGQVLDCVHETAKDQYELQTDKLPSATAKDLERVEQVLDVLGGDMASLLAQVAALEGMPAKAAQVLEVALATDAHCQSALHRLDELNRGFDRLQQQNVRLLKNQDYAAGMLEEMLKLMQRMASVADYVDDLRAAGGASADTRAQLQDYQHGARAFSQGHIAEAGAFLLRAAQAQPESGAAATALATVQAAGQDLPAAEKTLARAVRLRPQDAELVELFRQVTVVTGNTSSGSLTVKVGDTLDSWRLEQLLGHGGWGQVFRARRGDEVRALKVMRPDLSQDPVFVQRFKSEIGTLFSLRGQKHLVKIHDFGHAAACWYFVMELIEGMSLEAYLRRRGALTLSQVLSLFVRLADGLAAAHARGIIHRDIKPANILLRKPDGDPVLVDFGLAALEGGSRLTKTGGTAGYTPMFAAPEQLRSKPADARSDVYSLAASLYYALTYDKPEHREPDQFDPEHAPASLRKVLESALHHRPERRPANAAALATALRSATTTPPPKTEAVTREVPVAGGRQPGEIKEDANTVTLDLGGGVKMEFVRIPRGKFLMGSPKTEEGRDDDEEQHEVEITRDFYLGKYEVTQAQWKAVMGKNPSRFKGDNLPVEKVPWEDAVQFCTKLMTKDGRGRKFRLPSEAEWEYACRASSKTRFHFGDSVADLGAAAWYADNAGARTHEVGTRKPNAWGLYDMHGNVWEWCQDGYGSYEGLETKDPVRKVAGSEDRVLRGGSWGNQSSDCRAARRTMDAPSIRGYYVGFRVAFSRTELHCIYT